MRTSKTFSTLTQLKEYKPSHTLKWLNLALIINLSLKKLFLQVSAWFSYFIHVSAHCDIIKNPAQCYPIKKTLTLIIPYSIKNTTVLCTTYYYVIHICSLDYHPFYQKFFLFTNLFTRSRNIHGSCF